MRINRERLAVALVRADMTGNQLAEQAGVSVGTVCGVRRGRSCSEETAEKLAAILGRDILEEAQ